MGKMEIENEIMEILVNISGTQEKIIEALKKLNEKVENMKNEKTD